MRVEGQAARGQFDVVVTAYLRETKAGNIAWSRIDKDIDGPWCREGVMAPAATEGYWVELYTHEVDASYLWLLCHESHPPFETAVPREEDPEFYETVDEIWDLAHTPNNMRENV